MNFWTMCFLSIVHVCESKKKRELIPYFACTSYRVIITYRMVPYINISSLGLSEYMICQFSNGTTCPTAVFCPNTLVHFICNIEVQLGFTVWLLPNQTCTNKEYTERIVLLQHKYGGCNPSSSSQHGTCGPFTAQNVASSGCANFSLSVVATQGLNGAEIRCMNYDGSSYFPVATATISVIDWSMYYM